MTRLASVTLKLKGGACTVYAIAFFDPEESAEPIWIPRSLIDNLDAVIDGLPAGSWWTIEEEVELHLPVWLVEEKGLDSYAEELDT